MNFSIKVQYGIQAALELAKKFNAGPVQIGDIARSQMIPVRYLEQLLLILKRRHLLSSLRGKEGGYNLAKHPSDISVLEVIEALDGPINLTNKRLKKYPVLFELFENLQNNIKDSLKETTLEDLIFRVSKKERAYIYNYNI
ncbi:MAG: Rrf2 family transcriptional regulator [Candidatus Margulisbacteria bacterium]|nr:Rrf2 family transcriptional regulator [Candidatus Margulisiibacteriota bacterium]